MLLLKLQGIHRSVFLLKHKIYKFKNGSALHCMEMFLGEAVLEVHQ